MRNLSLNMLLNLIYAFIYVVDLNFSFLHPSRLEDTVEHRQQEKSQSRGGEQTTDNHCGKRTLHLSAYPLR